MTHLIINHHDNTQCIARDWRKVNNALKVHGCIHGPVSQTSKILSEALLTSHHHLFFFLHRV